MSFISRLKQIGLDVLKGIEFAGKEVATIEGFMPLAKLMIPQTPKIVGVEGKVSVGLTDIQNVVQQVEATSVASGGLTGPQKLQLAVSQITPLMNASGILNPKQLADGQTVQSLIEPVVNAFVAIENAHKAG